MDKYLTTQETAHELGVSVHTIRSWIIKGLIEARKISGVWLVNSNEVDRIKKDREPLAKRSNFFNKLFNERKKQHID